MKNLRNARIASRNFLEELGAERDRAQKIAQELEKFKLAVDAVSEHIIITDQDGVILFVNPAAERITGFSQSEILGKKAGAKELWGGLMDQEFYRRLWHTIKIEKQNFFAEIKNRRKNGQEYYAYTTISPILDRRGEVKFFVAVERDITKEKEVDKAKNEFVSLASHQLRTPPGIISWNAELLLGDKELQLNQKQRRALMEIFETNRRMIDLIDALLKTTRMELQSYSVNPVMVDLPNLVEDILLEFKTQIDEKHLDIQKHYYPKIPKIFADKSLVEIVIQNLISNAVKYTPKSGKISLGLSLSAAGGAEITIADTGYGIPESQQDKIFSKLFRADNILKLGLDGTGLGLYLAKSIVDFAQGKIWFESKEDAGSTFHVILPVQGMQTREGTTTISPGQ